MGRVSRLARFRVNMIGGQPSEGFRYLPIPSVGFREASAGFREPSGARAEAVARWVLGDGMGGTAEEFFSRMERIMALACLIRASSASWRSSAA